MAVFGVKSGKVSEEEIRESQLLKTDLEWWTQNSIQFFKPDVYRGKYIAVVNKEAFVGATYQEAEERAIAKYPNRRFIVHKIPLKRGKRI